MVTFDAEIVVVGSGAGGALTAALLAEAGRDVVVLEEGEWIDPGRHAPFSLGEMVAKYRNRGVTAALGRPPIAYVEACCAGGGPEVNSGLYHRPPAELVDEWRRRDGIVDLDPETLHAFSERIERDLSVGPRPGEPPPASSVLARGADALGWDAPSVPRWYRGDEKQTMTRTYLPRAAAAGARLVTRCRAHRVRHESDGAVSVDVTTAGVPSSVRARHVFVCAGAIQTAALLRRSGFRRNIGRLRVHPTVKVVARFADSLGDRSEVPVHQVKEFAPDLTLGGSASRAGHLAVALADTWEDDGARLMAEADRTAVYYAAIRADGAGRVLVVPGLRDPVVTFGLADSDLSRLARGTVHLGELLLAAGALEVLPSLPGAAPARSTRELAAWWPLVDRGASVMTIHLFSTAPMGEGARAATDSFGRVHGNPNVFVNDASLIPDAPGVNPQGTVMALAARNVARFLEGGR